MKERRRRKRRRREKKRRGEATESIESDTATKVREEQY